MSRNYEMMIKVGSDADDSWDGALVEDMLEYASDRGYSLCGLRVGTVTDHDERYGGAWCVVSTTLSGQSEKGWAAQIAKAVWEKAGKFVPVTVEATCLDDLPYTTHAMSEEDYEKSKEGSK